MRIVVIASLAESLLNFRSPLIAALLREGHEVICCAPGHDPQLALRLEALGASFLPIALDRTGINPLGDIRALLQLRRLFRRLRPDLVLGYTIKPVIYGSLAARLAGVPRIFSMITGLGYAFMGKSAKQRAVNLIVCTLYRTALRANRRVFFQNRDDLALFLERRLIRSQEQAVLINGSGVDLAEFPAQPPVLRPITFLLIARLLKDKGIYEYVEACAILKKRYPKVQFQLLGPLDSNPSAIAREQVEAWTRGGSIDYLGETGDVRPYIAAATVYVLPSYREGTPRTVLEAMAMGRPVITTDAPGCRETVREGENGFLVPVREVGGLVQAMERFILSPELALGMGRRSRELAEEKYDVHKVNGVIMKTLGLQGERKPMPDAKRCFDFSAALVGLIVLAPLLLLITLLVRRFLGHPAFFRQQRPGLNGTPFLMIKFRTMTDARDEAAALLPDERRLTPFGCFLRGTSLDELPELLNVLRGEMSLVGPRPLLMEYLPLYSSEQARRHEVRPGITGWAQVNGRNAISWEEKFRLDVWYVGNRSLLLDLKILWMTFLKVFRREGISQQGEATMSKFTGSGV